MKWALLAVLLGVAAYFGYHHWADRRAEEALLASVCAREITDEVTAIFSESQQAMKDGASVLTGAGLALRRKALYEKSSLGPHLGAFNHMGTPTVPHVKELAKLAAERCPDVFPEPIKAEKPIGYVWMLALELPE